MAETSKTPKAVVTTVASQLAARGLVMVDDGTVTVTDAGRAVAERQLATERAILHRLIEDWPGAEEPDVEDLIDEIVERLSHDDRPIAGVPG